MKKIFSHILKKLLYLLKGALSGAFISFLPVMLIHHKHSFQYIQNLPWSLSIFFALSIISGSLICYLLPSLSNKKLLLTLSYFFFYTACAALCQKIGLSQLVTDPYKNEFANIAITDQASLITVIPGLFLLSCAAINACSYALKNIDKPSPDISRSFHLNWLLYMSGISLIFGVWLPLLAVPGIWVLILWLD